MNKRLQNKISKLGQAELAVLIYIIKYPSCTARKISYTLEINYSHVYTYVNNLINLQLVIRIKEGRTNKYISEVNLNELQ